jgi:predicted  nucleic acid-binding Zn-ribbon protein
VREESPVSERIVLSQLREDSFVSYASNQEIPANVRAALSRAVELQQKAAAARQALTEVQGRKTRLTAEQDRVRQNLAAVGSETEPGRNYLKRMTDLDREIDAVNAEIAGAERLVQSTRTELEAYIAGLNLR